MTKREGKSPRACLQLAIVPVAVPSKRRQTAKLLSSTRLIKPQLTAILLTAIIAQQKARGR